jgi:alanyl-tRNA synthetase
MQYEKSPDGTSDLPNPCIDTGMGLERVAAVLQGKYWNYDTDLFMPVIEKIEELSAKKYSDEKFSSNMRVVADHVKSSCMLISDGVIPSNEGRGYVLRRIIRRAIRHMRELDMPLGSLPALIAPVFQVLGEEYPQNLQNQSMVEKFLALEENKFNETLDQGLKFLDQALKNDVEGGQLTGASAFKLYDTYGFPLDLTQIILREKDLSVDTQGFESCMRERKEESKKSWKGGAIEDLSQFHKTVEEFGETQFIGYDHLSCESKLLAILPYGEKHALVFEKTPFYAEGGGQLGDSGSIDINKTIITEIEDTQKPVEGLFAHIVKDSSSLEVGQTYHLAVNKEKRQLTMRNHSATHLLQSALIEVLGDHVKQAGSNVGPDRLRFDFTHTSGMTTEEVEAVENLVNQKIHESLPVCASTMSMDQALEKGAMALFGEKYGDDVRVLEMGNFSTELCGGTHVDNTNEIEYFKILTEGSLSSGVRRVEAITSKTAMNWLNKRSAILKNLEKATSSNEDKIEDKVNQLYAELKAKQKEIEQLKEKLNSAQSAEVFANPETLSGGTLFKSAVVPGGSDLRKMSDLYMTKYENGILLLMMENKGKLSVLLRAKKDSPVKCNDILNKFLAEHGGRGGGKPFMAQGSANSGCEPILEKSIKEEIMTVLGN